MKKGFSFIELLVTISLMGLILGLVLVNFGGFNKAKLLSTAADQLVVDLRLMATQAHSGAKPTACTGEFQGYQTSFSGNEYTSQALCDTAYGEIKTYTLMNGVVFSFPGSVIFYPLDDGVDSAVTIDLELDALTQTIQVDNAGVVYAE